MVTDTELVKRLRKSKGKDVEARNELLVRWMDYIGICTRALYAPRCDEEEKIQIVMMFLMENLHKFDPSRSSLKTFMARSSRYALGIHATTQNLQKRKAQFHTRSLNVVHPDTDDESSVVPKELHVSEEAVYQDMDRQRVIQIMQDVLRSVPKEIGEVRCQAIDGHFYIKTRQSIMNKADMLDVLRTIMNDKGFTKDDF